MTETNRTVRRLRRVLDLASFLMSRPGATVAEAAEHVASEPEEVLADLDMIFLCGLPPYTPTDLFEVVVEGDRIWLSGAEPLEKPFGMSRYEAIRLVTAARLVLGLPGAGETPELRDAAEKLETSLGEEPLVVEVEPDELVATLRKAMSEGRSVEILHLSAARGRESVRRVDPIRLFGMSGRVYLMAWCHSAQAPRTFSVDRIRSVEIRDEAMQRSDLDEDVEFGYVPGPEDLRATLTLGSEAGWVTHLVPLESIERLGDGGFRIVVASPDREFLVALTLRLAGSVRLVEPEWLRAEVAGRAECLLRTQTTFAETRS